MSEATLIPETESERTLPILPPIGPRYVQLTKDIEDIHDAARDAEDSSVYVEWLKQVFQSWDYGEVVEHMWLVFEAVRQYKGVNELYVGENKSLKIDNELLAVNNLALLDVATALRKKIEVLKKEGEENKILKKENGELVDMVAALRKQIEGLKKGGKVLEHSIGKTD